MGQQKRTKNKAIKKITKSKNPGKEIVPLIRMLPRIRVFAFEYVNDLTGKTDSGWAEKFGVNVATIRVWKCRKDVIEFMDKCLELREQLANEKLLDHQVEVIEQLLYIIKNAKQMEVRRKAIGDYFGLLGRRNVNSIGNQMVINNQNQAQSNAMQQTNIAGLTNEQLENEIKLIESVGEKKSKK